MSALQACKKRLGELKSLPYNRFREAYPLTESESEQKTLKYLPLPTTWEDFARLTVIRSGDRLVNFEPYPFQKEMARVIEENRITLLLKSRQTGCSEFVTNYMLWKAVSNPAFLGVVISKTQQDSSNLALRLRRSFDYLKPYATPLTDNMLDLRFESANGRGGRILFRNSTVDTARGLESVNFLLIDEAAFIPKIDEIYAAAMPSQSMSGDTAKTVIVSTPNTQSDWYFQQIHANNDFDIDAKCSAIREGTEPPFQVFTKDNRAKIILHWRSIPKYAAQGDSFLVQLKETYGMSESQIQREYNLSFSHSEQTIFSPSLVRSCAIGEWESEIDFSADYFIGVDTALQGEDYFVASVLKRDGRTGSLSLVEQYRKRKQTNDLNVYEVGKLLTKYKPVSCTIETNSAGQVVFESLQRDFPLENIQGFRTSQQSKEALISRLVLVMERNQLVFPAGSYFERELLSFIRDSDNKLGASGGAHDDTVMSVGFAVFGAFESEDKVKIKSF